MLKDLLLPITGTEGDDDALVGAAALAAQLEARLAVLVTVELPTPVPTDWGMYPASLNSSLYEEARARGEALAEELRSRLAGAQAVVEVRTADAIVLLAPRTVALHARHADLVVMTGVADGASRTEVERYFVDALMDSGRPVLVLPPGRPVELPLRRIVLAWQPTREASRAVHDALPLLRTAEAVDILMVDPEVGESAHGEEPGADIAAHLARHGLQVRVIAQPRMGQSVATVILRHASQVGAQMLVVGGYSRSRFREQILGGVTRELLAAAHLPVLFSH